MNSASLQASWLSSASLEISSSNFSRALFKLAKSRSARGLIDFRLLLLASVWPKNAFAHRSFANLFGRNFYQSKYLLVRCVRLDRWATAVTVNRTVFSPPANHRLQSLHRVCVLGRKLKPQTEAAKALLNEKFSVWKELFCIAVVLNAKFWTFNFDLALRVLSNRCLSTNLDNRTSPRRSAVVRLKCGA